MCCEVRPRAQEAKWPILSIRNGRVIDGTGNPWYRADVAISGDHIDRISRRIESIDGGTPDQVIDATDMCVCPGFVDIHTHPDLSVFYKEAQDYKLRQGVTTEVSTGRTAGRVLIRSEA